MLVVAGTLDIQEDKIEEYRAAATVAVAESEKEAGCVMYRFHQDISIPTRFLVFEIWESDEALNAHLQSEHIRTFASATRSFRVGESTVKRYYIASTASL